MVLLLMQDSPMQAASLQLASRYTSSPLHCLGMGHVAQASPNPEVASGRLLPEASLLDPPLCGVRQTHQCKLPPCSRHPGTLLTLCTVWRRGMWPRLLLIQRATLDTRSYI